MVKIGQVSIFYEFLEKSKSTKLQVYKAVDLLAQKVSDIHYHQ